MVSLDISRQVRSKKEERKKLIRGLQPSQCFLANPNAERLSGKEAEHAAQEIIISGEGPTIKEVLRPQLCCMSLVGPLSSTATI
jgi:hypothetical protein